MRKIILFFSCMLICQLSFGQRHEVIEKLVPQLMTVPNAVDTNQDGELSTAEVLAASQQLAKLDKNGDGELDWKEIGAWEEQLPLVRDHNITNLIDASGDVHISAEEIKNASKSLIQLDVNGDWHISKKELNIYKSPKFPLFSNKKQPYEFWRKFRGYTTENEGPILPGQNNKQFKGYLLVHDAGDAFLGQKADDAYLLDENGKRVHTWKNKGYSPEGSVAYLLENGQMLRTYSKYGWIYDKQFPVSTTTTIELVDWEGKVLWDYTKIVPQKFGFHHDVDYMPNGNILAIAYNGYTLEEMAAMGWDRKLGEKAAYKTKNNPNKNDVIWMCNIVELQPNLEDGSTKIVWQWNSWDHLVQNKYPDRPNYGDITDPNKINLNYVDLDAGVLGNVGQLHHLNAVDYNPALDLIVVSCPVYGEFWIIDHSTTTTEAASNKGGKYNKGGDLIYRYGNPHATGAGTLDEKVLYWQHDAQWIDAGLPGAGNIMVFNNGGRRKLDGTYNKRFKLLNFGDSFTEIMEIKLPLDKQGQFNRHQQGEIAWSWHEKNKADFFSPFMSGATRLPNGNTIFCRAYDKYLIEVTPEGEKVLDFSLAGWGRLYRIYKFGADYSGLKFK